MRKVIIGALVGIGVTAAIVIKKINDDREVHEISNEEGVKVVIKETFKDAIKRKINMILKWISENAEKVESITKAAATTATVIGIVTAIFDLYSSIKKTTDNVDQRLLEEVDEIRLRLLYLTPDVEVTNF